MLFVLICIDKPNSFELRSAMRPSHLAYIDAQLRQVKIAGPFLSDDGQTMLGSLIVIEARACSRIHTSGIMPPDKLFAPKEGCKFRVAGVIDMMFLSGDVLIYLTPHAVINFTFSPWQKEILIRGMWYISQI